MNELKESNNKVNKVLLFLVILLTIVLIVIICYFILYKKDNNKNEISSSSSSSMVSSEEKDDIKEVIRKEITAEFEKVKKGDKSEYPDITGVCNVEDMYCTNLDRITIKDVSLYDTDGVHSVYYVTLSYLCKDQDRCIYVPQCNDSCGIGSEDSIYLLVSMDDNNKVRNIKPFPVLDDPSYTWDVLYN